MIKGNVKDAYNATDWLGRETYYITEIDGLSIPVGATTGDIKDLAARIDGVRAEASIELAKCNIKFESLERMRKLVEKELFILIKSQGIAGLKTEAEVNGAVVIAIKDILAADVLAGKDIKLNVNNIITAMTPLAPSIPGVPTPTPVTPAMGVPAVPVQITLIPAIQIANSRMMFMQAVIDTLRDKASSLITIEGALKLEADVSRQSGGNTSSPQSQPGKMV